MAITTPARVRNRIQAAEAEIADDVLDEFIYEPTSKPSSNRTHARRSPKPIRNSGSHVRSALTGAQLRPWSTCPRHPPASRIRSTS
jgi:hypothetical protein